MFCSICVDGNDKNETALRGLNLWVFNFIESNLVKKICCDFLRNWTAERNFTKHKVHKLDLFPMVGAIGKSWSKLIISVVNKNKFRSSHKRKIYRIKSCRLMVISKKIRSLHVQMYIDPIHKNQISQLLRLIRIYTCI